MPPLTGRALSASRADLLETLRGQPELVSIKALIDATGLHRNTVREHMDALVHDGLVERHRAPAEGRGRPAWLYAATFGPQATVGNEYAGLATARFLASNSTDPSSPYAHDLRTPPPRAIAVEVLHHCS